MARKTNYEKKGKSYYRLTASIGRDANGKYIRKEFYAKSKKEAEKLRDEYLLMHSNGMPVDLNDVTFGELMNLWLFEIMYVSDRIKPSTFEKYEGLYRNYIMKSELYYIKMADLKSIQLQRYYNRIYCEGKPSSTIRTLNKFIKTFLNYAVDENYLIKNPCSGRQIVIPGKTELVEEEIDVFTEEEISLIKETLSDNRIETLVLLALGTGLRQGELLALHWSDIDFNNRELNVTKTLKIQCCFENRVKKGYEYVLIPPKSKTSIRTVPIPSSLIPILKTHKLQQMEEKLKAGSSYMDSDLVFTTESGYYINSRNLIRAFKRMLNNAGVPYRKFHTLRHTYATKLFEADIPLKTIQMLLGHSDISITANIYTHVMPKKRITAVEKLNRLFV